MQKLGNKQKQETCVVCGYDKLLLKKQIFFTFFAFKQFLLAVTILPAFEKALSDEVEVAGMHRYLLAIWASLGYLVALFFHHVRGHSFFEIALSE